MFSWCIEDRDEINYYIQQEGNCIVSEIKTKPYFGTNIHTVDIVCSGKVFKNIVDYKKYMGIKGFLKVKIFKLSDPVDCLLVFCGKSGYDLLCDSRWTEGHIERHSLGRFSVKKTNNLLKFFTSERDMELYNEVLAVETLRAELDRCKKFLEDPWKDYRRAEADFNRKLESKKARIEYKIKFTVEIVKVLEEKLPKLTETVITKNLMGGSETE